MRALRPALDPCDSDAAWERFILDVVRETPMPDFLLYGEPYPALNGIVLSAPEHRQLAAVTARFAAIFQKTVARLAVDPPALERLGFPWVAVELLGREAQQDGRRPFILGRFDFVLDGAGRWQLLEYNADTPSGLRETIRSEAAIVRHLRRELPGRVAGLRRSGPILAAATRRAFRHALSGSGRSGAGEQMVLGIVTDAGYAEDLAQAVFLQQLLRGLLGGAPPDGGEVAVVLGDLDNLQLRPGRLSLAGSGGLSLLGRPLDALYRYYPFETLLGQQAFADLFAAVAAGRLRLLNGLRGLLAQNKGLLAWIWDHRDDRALFTATERHTIAGHLPPVRWIGDVPPEEDLRSLVLKQVFGREGEEVHFGDQLTEADVTRCRAWGSYVVQQRVAVEPLRLVVRTSGGPEVQSLYPAVGSFTAAGRWAGYYTRAGGPVTTAHAKFVATLYEPESYNPPS